MSDSGRASPHVPKMIGRYDVVDVIGLGAMGAVYKAFDPLIKRTLAIKTLRVDVPRDSDEYQTFIKRFYREARISGALSHPNIVTLFDIGELESGVPFLVMEYVEGETLEALLDKGQRFKSQNVVALISQIAAGLDYAHSQGVIHRDIKPSNLILYDGDRMKVTDFGIAKLIGQEMTQAGQLLGTPSYMSPEQAMGEPLDGRSDLFSLGVVAFEMMSGEQPFPGRNVTSILYKLVHTDPVEPENLEMRGLVPQKWHEVFGKVLAKKPGERYQTGAAFVSDLEYCLGSWFGTGLPDAGTTAMGPAIPEDTPGDTAATHEITPSAPASVEPADAASTAVMRDRPEGLLPRPADAGDDVPPTLVQTGSASRAPGKQEDPDDSLATVAMTGSDMADLVVAPPTDDAARAPARALPRSPEEHDDEGAATIVMPAAEDEPATHALPRPVEGDELPPTQAAAGSEADDLPPTLVGTSAGSDEEELPATISVRVPAHAQEADDLPPTISVATPAPDVSSPPPGTAQEHTMMMDDAQLAQARARHVRVASPAPAPTQRMGAAPAVPGATSKPPRARRVAPLVWVTGLVLLAIAVSATALFLAGRLRGTPAPGPEVTTPLASREPGLISVQTRPEGASVLVNGESQGTTPAQVRVPLGSYEIEIVLEGHATRTQSVTLTEDDPREDLILALLPREPGASPGTLAATPRPTPRPTPRTLATGRADVRSRPPGAEVVVDGRSLGRSPLAGVTLSPGEHAVVLRLEGHATWEGTLDVAAGETARLEASLERVPPPTPVAPEVDAERLYLNTTRHVDTPARKRSGKPPAYPAEAPRLASGDSVSVSVSFVVTREGDVSELEIVESGGEALDQAVRAAITEWKYAPAEKGGVKVKVKVSIKQTFRAG